MKYFSILFLTLTISCSFFEPQKTISEEFILNKLLTDNPELEYKLIGNERGNNIKLYNNDKSKIICSYSFDKKGNILLYSFMEDRRFSICDNRDGSYDIEGIPFGYKFYKEEKVSEYYFCYLTFANPSFLNCKIEIYEEDSEELIHKKELLINSHAIDFQGERGTSYMICYFMENEDFNIDYSDTLYLDLPSLENRLYQ